MFSFFLFLVTGIIGMGHIYFSMGYAVWGAPVFLTQYISFFGGLALFLSSFLFLYAVRPGFLAANISSLLLSSFYVHFAYTIVLEYSFEKIASNIVYAFILLPFFLLPFLSFIVSLLGLTGLGRRRFPKDWIFPVHQASKTPNLITLLIVGLILFVILVFYFNLGKTEKKTLSVKIIKWEQENIMAVLEDYPGYVVTISPEVFFEKFENPEKLDIVISLVKDFSTVRGYSVESLGGVPLGLSGSGIHVDVFSSCGQEEGLIDCDDPRASISPFQ
jgi:hypothetical protein